MKLRNFFLAALAAAFVFASCEPVTPDVPNKDQEQETPSDPNTPGGSGDSEDSEDPATPAETITSIADVLKATDKLADKTIIEGVVISNKDLSNLTSKKGMYVQDATAALQFYLAADHEFAFGDKVKIDLSGVTVGEYNGAVQVGSLALDKITVVSQNNTVEAKTVTMADFLANKYEGQYVALENVQVKSEDLTKTWLAGISHTSINLEDAEGNSFVVFSSKYATYGAETVPQGSGTIKGISSISKGAVQIIFTNVSDFAGLTGERFSTEVTPPAGGDEEEGGDVVTPPAGDDDDDAEVSEVKTLTNAEILPLMTENNSNYSEYTIPSASGTWTVNAARNKANTFLQCCGKKGGFIKTPAFDKDIKSVTIHFTTAKQVYANNVYCVFPSTWTAPTADAVYPETGNVGKATTDGSQSLTIPVAAGNKQVYISIISTYAYYLDHIDVAF